MTNNILADLQNFAALYNGLLLTGLVSVLILLVIVSLQWQGIKRWLDENSLKRALKKLGRESLHDVSVPDGIDGAAFIEHVVLTPEGIMVLVIKRARGAIFAGDKIEQWTQVRNNKSYKFANPLHQLEESILAIRTHIEKGVPVFGRVLFIRGSEFPKGKPEQVIPFDEIEKYQAMQQAEEIPPSIRTAWQRLTEVASVDRTYQNQGMVLSATASEERGRNAVSLTLLVLLILWIVWRLAL